MLTDPLLTIASARGNYDVFMGDAVPHIAAAAAARAAVLLIDEKVARLHQNRLAAAMKHAPVLAISATEDNKSWQGVEQVIRFFLSNGCDRSTRVMVVGGGIIQDICAFACHIFFRGIQWEFYPTTVLAMADSCIGSKSGLNFKNTKNLVGVFENPRKIVVDPQFSATLADADLSSGLGEILKLALISGERSVQLFAENCTGQATHANLEPLIREALVIKKKFIEEDEFDYGVRRILNYGHTFGHALESVTNYLIPHGMAVVVGMDLVNFVATKYHMMSPETFDRIHNIITARFQVRTTLNSRQVDAIISAAAKDKKRTAHGVNLAIVKSPGEWSIELFRMDEELTDTVKSYFSSPHSICRINQ